jgi:hypothetical protein
MHDLKINPAPIREDNYISIHGVKIYKRKPSPEHLAWLKGIMEEDKPLKDFNSWNQSKQS